MQTLLNRLKLSHKYALIGLLAFIVTLIPTSMIVLDKAATARQAHAAAKHLDPARETLEFIRLSQQTRGHSSLYLSGNEAAADNLANLRSALRGARERAATRMREVGMDARTIDTLENLYGRMNETSERVRTRALTPPESFEAYTATIGLQLLLLGDIVTATGLDLDAGADTYPIINGLFYSLPPLTEQLGQIRALGAAMLARRAASDADRLQLAGIGALASDKLAAWETAVAEARRQNPLAESALASIERASSETQRALTLTQREIITAGHLSHSPADFMHSMTQAIDAQFELAAQAATVLGALLDERAMLARRDLWLLVAGLSVLVMMAFWLAVVITRSITSSLRTSLGMARTVAQGDLTSIARINGTDEVQQLLQALNDMNGSLVNIVGRVRGATDNIATAASQIAAGNHDLSERTISQAASLEETAASMEQLTSTVTQNSENALAANTLTRNATEVARRGGVAVRQFVETMSAIRETSSHIADIVGIIDGIAFQTNILALNAAVEAARAGEAGKGFAVVAAEVRSLAQRSATSAQEIRDLISQSATEVDSGSQLADAAGETMREVLESIERVGHLMNEIAIASTEQSSGIAQVNIAVGQMDGVTQQNAALVEEASAAAYALREQADMLVQTVSAFHLPDGTAGHADHNAVATLTGASPALLHAG